MVADVSTVGVYVLLAMCRRQDATPGDGEGHGSLAGAVHGVGKSQPRLGVSRRGCCSRSLGMR